MVDELKTDLNIDRPDDFYEVLIDAHRDLSDEQSIRLNAKLILLLANQIGCTRTLELALTRAREGVLNEQEN